MWLRSNAGRIVRRGAAPTGIVVCSFSAELYAIRRAVEITIQEWPQTTGIQINSDNQAAVKAVYPWSTPLKGVPLINQEEIQSLLQQHRVKAQGKHVKAHTGGKDVRSYLNSRVDFLAGKETGRY